MIIFLNLKNISKNELIYITRNTMALKGLKSDEMYVFYCLFIDQNHKVVLSWANFINFLNAIFWAQNVLLPPFLIRLVFYM